MHYTNVIASLAFLAVCIVSQRNLAQGQPFSRVVISRVNETNRILNGSKINLQDASQSQLDDYKKYIPLCLKKSDTKFRSLVGPILKIIGSIIGTKKRAQADANDGEQNDQAEVSSRTRTQDITTVVGLIGKVMAKFTVTELVTLRKIVESVANNGFFTRPPFLIALAEGVKACAAL